LERGEGFLNLIKKIDHVPSVFDVLSEVKQAALFSETQPEMAKW
jgi:hypothetical protein